MDKKKPACPYCGSGYIYFRVDGYIVCRRCGRVGKKEKKEKNNDCGNIPMSSKK